MTRFLFYLLLDIVLPVLYRHLSDPSKWVAGNVDNALSDIEIFLQVPVQRMEPTQEEDDNVEWEIEEDEEGAK